MKNKRFKKALSVFLSILMLMSCWVWVAPTDAAAADGNKYYVKVYVNIYDGSDGYGGTYSVEESTGKPKNYSWATNDGWYGRINMTGFTVFGEGGDYDAQDVSAALLEAEKLNTYYDMSGLSNDNANGDWDSKAIAKAEYTFVLDSFPVEIFWMNDENNWDGGNTGFAIRKLTVATSEGGTEHTMWEGLAGSDSETYNYYGSITPTGIHTCFEDYAKNYDMDDYKFYKAITSSSQRAWTDPYTYGSAGTYYLNEYANGGVSATFSEGATSVASTVDYIDTSSTDTYYVNYTNHSKTQIAEITGTYNDGNFVSSPYGIKLNPGETRSFEINKSNYSKLAKYNNAANFTFEYTLSNVYASDELNAPLAKFTQPTYIGIWNESSNASTSAQTFQLSNFGDFYLTFQTTEGILETVGEISGSNTDSVSFINNFYIDTEKISTWEQTGLRLHMKENNWNEIYLQDSSYSKKGTVTLTGEIGNSTSASFKLADFAFSSIDEAYKYNGSNITAYFGNTITPTWPQGNDDKYATLYTYKISNAWLRFTGNIFKGSTTSSNPGKIVFDNMRFHDASSSKDYNSAFSGTINVYAFDKSALRTYISETLLDFAPMSLRYNTTAFETYQNKLASAMNVLADQKTTQYAVNQVYTNLKSAVADLQKTDNLINQIDELTHTQYVDDIGSEVAASTDSRYVLIPLGEHTVPQKTEYIGNGEYKNATNKNSDLKTNHSETDTKINIINYRYWNIDYSEIDSKIADLEYAINNFDNEKYNQSFKTDLQNVKDNLEAMKETVDIINTPTSQEDIAVLIVTADNLIAHLGNNMRVHQWIEDDQGNYVAESDEDTHWYTCKICGYELVYKHTFAYENLDAAQHKVTCVYNAETFADGCGYTFNEDHVWVEGETVATSCTEGNTSYSCICGATKTEATTVSNHSFAIADNGDGTHISKCSKCGVNEADAVAEAHTYTYTNNNYGTHTATCGVCDYKETVEHIFANPVLARPTDADNDGVWDNGTYTYTCACGETKEEDAVRADYSELTEAIQALEGIKDDANLSDEEKTVIDNAIAEGKGIAQNLVTAEQDQIDALVKKLEKIKADADEAIRNKELDLKKITEATSGVKVQFIKADGLGEIDSVQLGKDTAFKIRVANGNADSNITITNIQGEGVNTTGATLNPGESADYGVTMPTTAGIKEYTITYTIDGLKNADGTAVTATTKAYIYVKEKAVTPYHLMDEDCANIGVSVKATSEWAHTLEASAGDFAIVSNNTAPYADFGNSNLKKEMAFASLTVNKYYDYEDDKCFAKCTDTGEYVKGDAHAATYRYYIDTSLAPTWQKAGFKVAIAETAESVYDNAALKYIRLANNEAYLTQLNDIVIDGEKVTDKKFYVTLKAGNTTNVPGKTWETKSNGDMSVSFLETTKDQQNEWVFGAHANGDAENIAIAYEEFSGAIPQKTEDAKMMFSTRMEYNMSGGQAEAVTMTTHLYITSYDKGALRSAVEAAETAGYNSAYFDSAAWTNYENALMNAKTVLGKAETNQAEIDAAKKALENAIAALNSEGAEAKFVLTVTHSIHENADKNSDATSTLYDYYLVNGNITPAQIDLTDKQINKKSDIANLTITEDTEYTYYYWYINYSGVQGAIGAADAIINDTENGYSEEYKQQAQTAKDALEDILDGKDATSTPASQDDVDNAIGAVNALTHEHNQDVVIPAVDATCDATGLTAGVKCSVCGKTTKAQEETPKIEHNWTETYTWSEDNSECTATRTCANFASHNVTETIKTTSTITTPATCEGKGKTTYTADFIADWADTQTKEVENINALNHSWTVTYKWSNDYKTCTATRACGNDATHNVTATANVTSAEKIAATCTAMGTTTYTATFTETWAAKQITDVQDIPVNSSNHDYDKNNDGEVTREDATYTAPIKNADGIWSDAVYSYTCDNNCGTPYTEKVARADYEAYDKAVEALNKILNENKAQLTDEAKNKISEALEDNSVDDNLDADSQQRVTDAANALNEALRELTDEEGKLKDEYKKPDSEAAEEAVEKAEALNGKIELPADVETQIANLRTELNKVLEDISKDTTPTAAEYQNKLDTIEDAANKILEDYKTCKENGHKFGDKVIATYPVYNEETKTWSQGTYTKTCSVCGYVKTIAYNRANYEAYDKALADLNALLANDNITEATKTEIRDVINKNTIRNDLMTPDQDKVTAAADALKAEVDKITNDATGAYEKPNSAAAKDAVEKAEALKVKIELPADVKTQIENLRKELDDILDNISKDDNATEAEYKDDLKKVEDAANVILNKYAACEKDGHKFGDKVIATYPVYNEETKTWSQGTYTKACSVCGYVETIAYNRANYEAYDKALADLNALLANDNITEATKTEIREVINKNTIRNDLMTPDQDKVTAAADALKAEVDKITNDATGAYEKPNSAAAKDAVEKAEALKVKIELPADVKTQIENLRKELDDILDNISKDDNATEAEYKDDLKKVEDAANVILNKYAACEKDGHKFGDKVIATYPVYNEETKTWSQGTYTKTCSVCGYVKTIAYNRANYEAYDKALADLNALLASDKLTQTAENKIIAAIEANKIANNIMTPDQKKVDDAAAALNVVLGELTDENGNIKKEYEKVDYTNYNNAVNAAKALENVMTPEDKAAVEAAKKTVTDAGITEETSKAVGQTTLDAAAAAIAAINAKYSGCSTGNHKWGTPVLTTEPTETTKGIYTETCTVCGTTQTTEVGLADYSKFNTVVEQLEALANKENLTDAAVQAIADALAQAEALDKNLPADATTANGKLIKGGQEEINALVEELKKVVGDTNAAITNGSALKPDYTKWEKAETAYDTLEKTNVKSEIITEANNLKEQIAAKQAVTSHTQATATQAQINTATARLNEIIAGINNGTMKTPDYSGAQNAIDKVKETADNANIPDNKEVEIEAEIAELERQLEELKKTNPDSTNTEAKAKIEEIKVKAEDIVKTYKKCVEGTHDYVDATCLVLQTCRTCGATTGDYAEHDYGAWTYDAELNKHKRVCTRDASHIETAECNDSATDTDCNCDVCGHLVAHNYADATCTAPKTCSVCSATEGSALGHLDRDKDHNCDRNCGTTMGTHADTNNDHNCEYCGKKASDCVDADNDTDHNCDICGAENVTEHNYVDPVLTQRPTQNKDGTWNNGEYTKTCAECGTTVKVSDAERANYAAYDSAKAALEALLNDTTITGTAKTEIEAVLEANKIADDYIATEEEQAIVDAAAAALKAELDKLTDEEGKLEDEYKKPDYTKWDEAEGRYDALDKKNVKDEIIAEAEALKKQIAEKQADYSLTQATATQTQIDEATARLNQIIEGIKDGSLLNSTACTHAYAVTVVAPTCHSLGYTLHVCKNCGYAYRTDEQPATDDHKWGRWFETESGSCLEYRMHERSCLNEGCYEKQIEIMRDANGDALYGKHYVVVIKGQAATCVTPGYTDYERCVVCGEITEAEVIPATGHVDNNKNGNCDVCNYVTNPSIGKCDCLCHNDSFFGKLLYNFVNFFWKLFKIQQGCQCGAQHW